MATRVATDLTLYDVNPTGKEIGRGAYGRVFEVDYQLRNTVRRQGGTLDLVGMASN